MTGQPKCPAPNATRRHERHFATEWTESTWNPLTGCPKINPSHLLFYNKLTVEAVYHSNRIEGNQLSLPEVRAIVEAFWAESDGCSSLRRP